MQGESRLYRIRILIVRTFIGGIGRETDKETLEKGLQVAIGTTGRLCQLVKNRQLNLSKVNLFVLDEADKLMEEDFQAEIKYAKDC